MKTYSQTTNNKAYLLVLSDLPSEHPQIHKEYENPQALPREIAEARLLQIEQLMREQFTWNVISDRTISSMNSHLARLICEYFPRLQRDVSEYLSLVSEGNTMWIIAEIEIMRHLELAVKVERTNDLVGGSV